MVIDERIPYFSDDTLACSESTLRYLIEQGVVDLPMSAVKMMTGLHGNMGRCANCGAVNAGTAALGSHFGRTQPGESGAPTYRAVEAFLSEFEGRFGAVKCAQLVGDNDPASLEQQRRCSGYVLGAAEIVTRLIEEDERAKAEK